MSDTPKKQAFVLRFLQEKCPKCGEGHVFVQNSSFFSLPVMNDHCEKCAYRFDREPGYFLGAMYLSYGFAVLQGIITFFLALFLFPDLPTFWSIFLVLIVILIFGRKNYKLSRVLYIHIFPW